MMTSLSATLQKFLVLSMPTLCFPLAIVISLRLVYLYKNKLPFVLYKEVIMLSFAIYILCLFQVVTFQDVARFSTNNFIPFREITRYEFGSYLFMKNIVGNMILFLPYGFFCSYYLKINKPSAILILTLIASLSIELMQLMIGRVFDVDDILLNLLGGYIGFIFYSFLKTIVNQFTKLFKHDWVLNILACIILISTILLLI